MATRPLLAMKGVTRTMEIGYAIAANTRGAGLDGLSPVLECLAALGYTHAELSAKSLSVIINGALNPVRLAALQAALADRPVRLTVHGSAVSTPVVGNLMDVATPAQRQIVAADIALAAAIGAEVVVYHSGMLRIAYGDEDAVAHGMAAERDALRALGDEAGRHGIRIAVENVHPTDLRILHRAYGFDLERLAEHVAQVNHPQVGICLDTGHGFLSARYFQFDYLAQVRAIAPLVNHVHLTDNFGRPLLDEHHNPEESLILGVGTSTCCPAGARICSANSSPRRSRNDPSSRWKSGPRCSSTRRRRSRRRATFWPWHRRSRPLAWRVGSKERAVSTECSWRDCVASVRFAIVGLVPVSSSRGSDHRSRGEGDSMTAPTSLVVRRSWCRRRAATALLAACGNGAGTTPTIVATSAPNATAGGPRRDRCRICRQPPDRCTVSCGHAGQRGGDVAE